MLLHQADKLIIGQVLTDIREEFQIDEFEAGLLGTGALVVGALFYPLWGYLYDRYGRAKLLALASAIWGLTTMFGAIARPYSLFLVSRASTGIDDSSYPGVYSLISDYFGPSVRGKIYGVLQLTAPLGFMLSLVLVLALDASIGWRNIFLLTGGLGLVVALFIFFGVRELPRGTAEPELEGMAEIAVHKIDRAALSTMFQRRTLLPLFVQGFFGVFPLNVMTFWFFTYMETERGYDQTTITVIMGIAVLTMAVGAFLGGWLGDWLFKRTPRGRLIVALTGIIAAMVMMFITLNVPNDNITLFGILLPITALFVLFSGPNVISTIYDITLPEVRSSSLAIQYFIENIGAASSPALVGWLAASTGGNMGLTQAILLVCVSMYALCALAMAVAVYLVPRDLVVLREQMRERAAESLALSGKAKPIEQN
jgi:MFS transporter, Spinster family, sphingosine-1-phosphate transporter